MNIGIRWLPFYLAIFLFSETPVADNLLNPVMVRNHVELSTDVYSDLAEVNKNVFFTTVMPGGDPLTERKIGFFESSSSEVKMTSNLYFAGLKLVLNNKNLFFTARSATGHRGLYFSNGTLSGTKLVLDLTGEGDPSLGSVHDSVNYYAYLPNSAKTIEINDLGDVIGYFSIEEANLEFEISKGKKIGANLYFNHRVSNSNYETWVIRPDDSGGSVMESLTAKGVPYAGQIYNSKDRAILCGEFKLVVISQSLSVNSFDLGCSSIQLVSETHVIFYTQANEFGIFNLETGLLKVIPWSAVDYVGGENPISALNEKYAVVNGKNDYFLIDLTSLQIKKISTRGPIRSDDYRTSPIFLLASNQINGRWLFGQPKVSTNIFESDKVIFVDGLTGDIGELCSFPAFEVTQLDYGYRYQVTNYTTKTYLRVGTRIWQSDGTFIGTHAVTGMHGLEYRPVFSHSYVMARVAGSVIEYPTYRFLGVDNNVQFELPTSNGASEKQFPGVKNGIVLDNLVLFREYLGRYLVWNEVNNQASSYPLVGEQSLDYFDGANLFSERNYFDNEYWRGTFSGEVWKSAPTEMNSTQLLSGSVSALKKGCGEWTSRAFSGSINGSPVFCVTPTADTVDMYIYDTIAQKPIPLFSMSKSVNATPSVSLTNFTWGNNLLFNVAIDDSGLSLFRTNGIPGHESKLTDSTVQRRDRFSGTEHGFYFLVNLLTPNNLFDEIRYIENWGVSERVTDSTNTCRTDGIYDIAARGDILFVLFNKAYADGSNAMQLCTYNKRNKRWKLLPVKLLSKMNVERLLSIGSGLLVVGDREIKVNGTIEIKKTMFFSDGSISNTKEIEAPTGYEYPTYRWYWADHDRGFFPLIDESDNVHLASISFEENGAQKVSVDDLQFGREAVDFRPIDAVLNSKSNTYFSSNFALWSMARSGLGKVFVSSPGELELNDAQNSLSVTLELVADAYTDVNPIIEITSSDQSVLPANKISLSGSGKYRELTISADGSVKNGEAVVAIKVVNAGYVTYTRFFVKNTATHSQAGANSDSSSGGGTLSVCFVLTLLCFLTVQKMYRRRRV